MEKEKKGNFLMQGAILGASSIIVRIIGLFYRVPLNNILGEKGVAYYGIAFDVYSILLLLSSYSMPLAISKMVSKGVALKEYKNTRKILIHALIFSATCGIVAFLITFLGADLFAKILNYPQAAIALRVLSPALIILSILGVLRGYFQGLGTMVPTAVSNIIEQIINAVVSIVAASTLIKTVSEATISKYPFPNVREAYGAAGSTLGTVCGAGAALLFIIFIYLLNRKKTQKLILRDQTNYEESTKDILKVIVATIIPVILSTTIYNIGGLIDTGLFSNIMSARGMDHDQIDILTGMCTGNYRLIIQVPVALASALASSLIPSVVKSMAQKNKGNVITKVESSIKVMMIVAMPCAAGIGFLAKPIINFLFPTSIDPDKVSLMLIIGCIAVVFISLSTITNSILQGIDKMRIPVRHCAIALVIRILVIVGLLYIFDINIFSLVIGDIVFSLSICLLNSYSLRKYLGFKQEILKTFILPGLCAIMMGVVAMLVNLGFYSLFSSYAVSVILTIVVSAIVYGFLLLLFKVIEIDELYMIPGGTKIIKIAKKLHLM